MDAKTPDTINCLEQISEGYAKTFKESAPIPILKRLPQKQEKMDTKTAIEKLIAIHAFMSAFAKQKESTDALVALDLAISALSKQVPMKPVYIRPFNNVCPTCRDATIDDGAKYCWNCGQAIEEKNDGE